MSIVIEKKQVIWVEVNDVEQRFCELVGCGLTRGGLWNADWSKPVYDIQLPSQADDCDVLAGESKYLYRERNVDELCEWRPRSGEAYTNSPDCLKTQPADYKGKAYKKIDFKEIVGWLHHLGELPGDEILFYLEW